MILITRYLVQYADFLAGAIKLKIDFGLGTRDPNIKVTVDGENPGSREEMEQSFYFFGALRYCLWGNVHDFGDGVNNYDPRKMVMGRGLVVISPRGVRPSTELSLHRWGLHGMHPLLTVVQFLPVCACAVADSCSAAFAHDRANLEPCVRGSF